jgi:glyoxylase-like metal-dependent hydrolase (beta-lactamase superfamily II)
VPEGSLQVLPCGSTVFPLSRVFRGRGLPRRVFPSNAFLYTHPSGRRVLVDTGYPPTLRGTGLVGALYRRILPALVSADETVDQRLLALGLSPEDVECVVLTHLHPDHVGGVRWFPEATFVVATLRRSRVREGVFRALLPPWFAPGVIADEEPATVVAGMTGFDLLGDGSVLVVPLPGHARGHLGVLVEGRVLVAGDAAWGREFLGWSARLRRLPRFISDDARAHERTSEELARLETTGVRLCFSHDAYAEGEALLGAEEPRG